VEGISKEERNAMRSFVHYLEEWAQDNVIVLEESCFMGIIRDFGHYEYKTIASEFKTERSVLCGMWVIFLRAYRMTLTDEKEFKYKSINQFMIEYSNMFDDVDEATMQNLYYTAQWMHRCLSMLPAKRNKGFYMRVIPKVVEGFHAKYATGSGQSRVTTLRVILFEREGSVVKNHRCTKLEKQQRQLEAAAMDSVWKGLVLDSVDPRVLKKARYTSLTAYQSNFGNYSNTSYSSSNNEEDEEDDISRPL
jgi:hypothetical protein